MASTKTWFVAVMLVAMVVLAGCAQKYTQEEVERAVATAVSNAKAEAHADLVKELTDQEQRIRSEFEEKLAEKDEELAKVEAEKDDLAKALEETVAKYTEEKETAAKEVDRLTSGDLEDNLFLGDTINFNLDDGDIASLFDGEIEFNDDTYDVEEHFIADGNFFVGYSLVDDDEFGSDIYLILDDREVLQYWYEFKDPIDMTEISVDEPLEITFLGQPIEIVAADDDGIKILSGTKKALGEGESFVYKGHTIALKFVGTNEKCTVCVDDECDVVTEDGDEDIGEFSVGVEDVLVNDREGFATVVISDDNAVYTQDNNDDYMDDESYNFYMDTDGDMLNALIVTYDEKHDDLEDEFEPIGLGEELCFYDYVCIEFHKELYRDYEKFTMEFDDFDDQLEDGTNVEKQAVVLESHDDIFNVNNEEVDELYVAYDGKVYYEDNGDWYEADDDDVTIENDDYVMSLEVGPDGIHFGDIVVDARFDDEKLGDEEDDAEATDVIYDVGDGFLIGTREYDVLLPDGVVVEDVENNADNDEVSIWIPSDIVEVEVFVYA